MTHILLSKAPSAQNAIALIGESEDETLANIVALKANDTLPSYQPARTVAPILMEKNNLEWCIRQLASMKWENKRAINVELINSLDEYRALISPVFYRQPRSVRFEAAE